jgi:hypothetical protein
MCKKENKKKEGEKGSSKKLNITRGFNESYELHDTAL